MFKSGNTWMIIIPGFLMVSLFIGGWLYVVGEDTMQHENLQDDAQINANIDGEDLSGGWNWTTLPEGELAGEDYIGIIAYENGEILPGDEFDQQQLELRQDGEVIYEEEGTVVEEGLIFEFPNRMEATDIYGYEGAVSAQLPDASDEVEIYYLHTWINHAGQGGEDPSFNDPPFPGMEDNDDFWWVISETVSE
ncbi:hypothetical protein [Salicibibacter kimchii]|uniref:Uncharacterized protein n=1 Tax=Salicibibacter kimchii TaxID=2099786 RepID=A0A345BUV7_9BACI|nr:hypothetical protein [Salicibibacter kimchii]AXF54738.1 hypothetical protein DT065_01020 [Salicibibacter kimchii]